MWFLWTPVRRSGWIGTLCVALAACLIQAGIELTAAKALRSLPAPDAAAALLVGLALVLSSLFLVSYIAARMRPGAGTLLTVIAIVAVSVQSIVKGPLGFSLSHMAARVRGAVNGVCRRGIVAQRTEGREGRMTVAIPKVRVSPETNTIGGITFEDPYQWLEASSEETTQWQSAQDDAAREYIRAWPGWQTLRNAVERSRNAGQGFVFPAYHDGLWISGRDLAGASRILPGKELATVQMLDGPAGHVIDTLLDLNEIPHTKPIQLGGLALSPDKKLM